MSSASGPIADLSYRTYEGQLDAPTHRWKVIAKQNIYRVIRHKGYWWMFGFGSWYYFIMAVILLFVTLLQTGGTNFEQNPLLQIDWTAQYLHGFSFGQMFYMFIGLIAGAGAIANDNRCNALLVYLSKPCTKKDYIIGKWVGVFVPVAAAMLIPALLFYAFGAMNFRDMGFISDDPLLPLRMILIILVGAAFHTSMVLAVSSMFNQGRLAGATYAGIYFLPSFITFFMGIILEEARDAPASLISLAEGWFYMSIDGLSIGFAKLILELDSPDLFLNAGNGFNVGRPAPLMVIGVMAVLSTVAVVLIRRRVRAVEVA